MTNADIIGLAVMTAGVCVVAICAVVKAYAANTALDIMSRIEEMLAEQLRLQRQVNLRERGVTTPPTRRPMAVR